MVAAQINDAALRVQQGIAAAQGNDAWLRAQQSAAAAQINDAALRVQQGIAAAQGNDAWLRAQQSAAAVQINDAALRVQQGIAAAQVNDALLRAQQSAVAAQINDAALTVQQGIAAARINRSIIPPDPGLAVVRISDLVRARSDLSDASLSTVRATRLGTGLVASTTLAQGVQKTREGQSPRLLSPVTTFDRKPARDNLGSRRSLVHKHFLSESQGTALSRAQLREARETRVLAERAFQVAVLAASYPILKDVVENREALLTYIQALQTLVIALASYLGYGTAEIMPIEFHDT